MVSRGWRSETFFFLWQEEGGKGWCFDEFYASGDLAIKTLYVSIPAEGKKKTGLKACFENKTIRLGNVSTLNSENARQCLAGLGRWGPAEERCISRTL